MIKKFLGDHKIMLNYFKNTGSREDNPFSFRHFLRRSQNPCPAPPTDRHRISEEEFEANRCGGARPKIKTNSRHGLESDLKSPCGLPDFVQDYLGVEHDLNPTSYSNGYHVPDQGFGINQNPGDNPLDLPRSHSPIHAAGTLSLLTLYKFYVFYGKIMIFPFQLLSRSYANTFRYCKPGIITCRR